jgi:hypothetical protein
MPVRAPHWRSQWHPRGADGTLLRNIRFVAERSPDRSAVATEGLLCWRFQLETCGRVAGTVGRPFQNMVCQNMKCSRDRARTRTKSLCRLRAFAPPWFVCAARRQAGQFARKIAGTKILKNPSFFVRNRLSCWFRATVPPWLTGTIQPLTPRC